LLEVLVELVLE